MNAELIELARDVGAFLQSRHWCLATAESCTGGLVATVVTEIAGSSEWFDRSFVTYSNEAKIEMLGVRTETLARYGAVSEETVGEMVAGVLDRSHADIAVAISGIAGPSGGTPAKPVGTVCLAWMTRGGEQRCLTRRFEGDRAQVRLSAAMQALREIMKFT